MSDDPDDIRSETVRRLYAENKMLRAAVDLVLAYDETENDDGVVMMLNYNDAIEACRKARASVEKKDD